jgi:O-antigen/teichoic acid export membrane protein
MIDVERTKRFVSPKLRHIREFLIAQGAVQILTTVLGFLCIRLLSVPSYAKYSVIYGVLGSLTILTDIGFSGTLASLVGERVGEAQILADYVETIRVLRRRLFLIVAPLSAVVFPILVVRQHWPALVVIGMVIALIISVWTNGVSSSYGAVLILRRDRTRYYRVQLISAALRLGLLGVIWLLHSLNAFTAIAINIAAFTYTARQYYLRSQELLGSRGQSTPELRREVIHLGLPNVPNVAFYAIQGQITVFIVAAFGHTASIAGVGALSRLGQLFLLLGQMNPILIEPYFAKLPAHKFKRAYLGTMVICLAILFAGIALGLLWPQALLALLGSKYATLKNEVVWMLASSGISYVGGVLWTIHFARRFVFWWASWLNIAVIVSTQIIYAINFDLSTVRGVVILGFATAAGGALVTVITGIAGLLIGPRVLHSRSPELPINGSAVKARA